MELPHDQVTHVAALARLGLADDETERLAGDLGAILEHVRDLEGVDVTGVAETAQVGVALNTWREDEVAPSLAAAVALANAPDADGAYFRVGAIQE